MIGRLSKIIIIIVLFSACENQTVESCEDCELEIDTSQLLEKDPELDTKKMGQYIDSNLVPAAKIFRDSKVDYPVANLNGEFVEIQSYQGQLMDANLFSTGGTFYFQPYDYYDEELEMKIKSDYPFRLTISLTKEQLDYLAITEKNDETNNIKWDYFENLFTIYYYLDNLQKNLPLSIKDEGKTEWDG